MVKRKDGTYQEKIKLSNGKYKYFYGKTKAEVLKKLQQFTEEEERGAYFVDVAQKWWEEHENKVAYSTMRGYKARFDNAVDTFGATPIKDITTGDISVVITGLSRKGYSKKVVSTQLNVLNMIFDMAVVDGHIQFNPCTSVHVPKGLPKKKRKLPTNEELMIARTTKQIVAK